MKQLKYIKLFEAFESVKLTKILGYINQKSRNKFLEILKNLSKNYDFPMSQFSDDMFQYLPFNKALKANIETVKEPCKATSKNQFGQYGIGGEKCESGKIKRLWGSRQRVVDCQRCKGTGVEPLNSELKLLKFWFSSDKEFIDFTGVDGVIRNFSPSVFMTTGSILANRSGFQQLANLPNLTQVTIRQRQSSSPISGVIYKSRGDVFVIQNRLDGGSPNGTAWQAYGRYSWNVTNGDFYEIKVIVQDLPDDDDNSENPYNWNISVDRYFRVTDQYSSIETKIKDANFALVLDLDRIKKGDYTTKRDIQTKRAEIKSGSRLDMTDDEIKKANIQRYISEIAKRADIVSDISNIKNLVNRGIGGRWTLFLQMGSSRYQNNFSKITELYYGLMSAESDENKKYYIEQIQTRIKSIYSHSSQMTSELGNNLQEIKNRLKKEGEDVEKKYLPIIESLERISQKFYNKVMSGKFETIEDLEIVRQRMINLESFYNNSFYGLSNLKNFCDSLINSRPERAYGYLVGTWRVDDYYDTIIKGLPIVERLVERL